WPPRRVGLRGPLARPDPVPPPQQREVSEGHVDLLGGALAGLARAVLEMDGHLAQPEPVDPGLVRHLAVDRVALDLDALEVRGLQDLAPVGAVAAGGVADGHA